MELDAITDVFFDLDHTLWDFDRNSRLAFKRVFHKNKIGVDLDTFISVYEPVNFEYWKLFREEKVTKKALRHGRLSDSFKKLEMEFTLDVIETLSVSYIDELPHDNHLFDGAEDILRYLQKKYNLHIITNGFEEVQHIKIKNSGIAPFFSTITTSEEVGVKKPNPLVFKRAMEKANAIANTSVMIGDTFEADILGAEAVGMQTIFYNYRLDEVCDNYNVIANLTEIKKFL